MKSLKVLEKPKKYPETIATNASCFTDITSYTENIPRGSKELENLIIAFARRPDSETYTELIFQFWKKFVENAKFRGITYDPYLGEFKKAFNFLKLKKIEIKLIFSTSLCRDDDTCMEQGGRMRK